MYYKYIYLAVVRNESAGIHTWNDGITKKETEVKNICRLLEQIVQTIYVLYRKITLIKIEKTVHFHGWNYKCVTWKFARKIDEILMNLLNIRDKPQYHP